MRLVDVPVIGEIGTEPDARPGGLLVCQKCDREFAHTGRGRKPRTCPDCRPTRSSSGGGTASAEKQADAAIRGLKAGHSMIALGLVSAGYMQTASAFADAEDKWEIAAREALVNDPKLAKMIVGASAKTGSIAFFGAYAGLAMAVGQAAYVERREIRAAREESEGE